MQASNNGNRIVAYFATSGQVVSASDQLRSVLQITDPNSMKVEQVTRAGASNESLNNSAISNQAATSSPSDDASSSTNLEGNSTYMLTVAVSNAQNEQAMEIIRAQGGIIK